MTTGERITQKRKELALSQEELGNQLNVSRQAVYKWESDNGLPDVDKLQALCKLFDVSIDWLLTGEEKRASETKSSEGETERIIIREVQRKKSRLRYMLAAAAVLFLVLVLVLSSRIKKIEKNYSDLQNTITWLRSDIDRSIGSISSIIQKTLDEYNNSILDSSIEISKVDYSTNTIFFDVNLTPKKVYSGMEVKLDVISRSLGGEEIINTVYANKLSDVSYAARLECPLSDDISITCTFIRDGEKENALLSQYYSLYTNSFEGYAVLGPLFLDRNNDRTGFRDKYCDVFPERYYVYKNIRACKTRSLSVALYDDNDEFVCMYSKIDGEPKDLITNQTNVIWFERPMDTVLDPDMEYYERLTIIDEFGRTLEIDYKYF